MFGRVDIRQAYPFQLAIHRDCNRVAINDLQYLGVDHLAVWLGEDTARQHGIRDQHESRDNTAHQVVISPPICLGNRHAAFV